MKIAVISDTHRKHFELTKSLLNENIDLIIHAGDASNVKSPFINVNEMLEFLTWYESLPIKYKIFVPGNHDSSIEHNLVDFTKFPSVTVLIDESIQIEDLNIFGSPYTPSFGQGWAYNKSHSKLSNIWRQIIPDNTDILITHGPPKGVLDLTTDRHSKGYIQVGCKSLLNRVLEVQPQFHIFGHIHDEPNILNNGIKKINDLKTTFINASNCDLKYKCVNKPIIFEIV